MALLKFKAFNKMLSEIKADKLREKAAKEYKKVYMEKLSSYGVSDASELNDDQLSEFLENLKTYKNNKTKQI
tara:strand:+ start:4456 stop:4671 length:216 start_codon:yes stop_codon:yes gene_type:complete